MTNSALAVKPAQLLGSRYPRFRSVPEYVSSTGDEIVELCRLFKLNLLDWQVDVLTDFLGERADGKWAALETGLVVPRQNGKTEVLIARVLAGLFLLGELEIIYSAHRADTSMGIFKRFVKYLKRNPTVARQIKSGAIKINNTHGQESVLIVATGATVQFRTRAQEGGRGFSADCVIFDEAFMLSEEAVADLGPTLIARPNPQLWYTGTAVDQQVHRNGTVFARLRERGIKGDDDLAFYEWSLEGSLEKLDPEVLDNRETWAQVNPSLNYVAGERLIAMLRGSMRARKFATECLCIGDWPRTDDGALHVIDLAKWNACLDLESSAQSPVTFAFDVTPAQTHSAISCAGDRQDGLVHVELIEHRRGTAWVAGRLKELKLAHKPYKIVCDASGPASSIVADVEKALGEEVHRVTAGEHAAAFGGFVNAVEEIDETTDRGKLRHGPTPEMDAALEGATSRPMGDGGFAWSRKNSEVDISPLVASTLAFGVNAQRPKNKSPRFISMSRL